MKLVPDGQQRMLAEFFKEFADTTIISYLQGRFGQGWVDDLSKPTCARVIVGDFCFVAGDAHAPGAALLSRIFPEDRVNQWVLTIPADADWASVLMRENPGRYTKLQRYTIRGEPERFDRQRLRAFVEELPSAYRLVRINAALSKQTTEQEFSQNFCSNFLSPEQFVREGIGYVALEADRIVAGASSYTVYDQGIEIEIGTDPAYRRKGLATACGAALILHCLECGLYPAWDAANLPSVGLAEKLGYWMLRPYDTYRIQWLNGATL